MLTNNRITIDTQQNSVWNRYLHQRFRTPLPPANDMLFTVTNYNCVIRRKRFAHFNDFQFRRAEMTNLLNTAIKYQHSFIAVLRSMQQGTHEAHRHPRVTFWGPTNQQTRFTHKNNTELCEHIAHFLTYIHFMRLHTLIQNRTRFNNIWSPMKICCLHFFKTEQTVFDSWVSDLLHEHESRRYAYVQTTQQLPAANRSVQQIKHPITTLSLAATSCW